MVEAQTRMQTDQLFALMFIAALVGFFIDLFFQKLCDYATRWK